METGGADMKIKDAEEILRVPRGTIRFYEKNGLVHPERRENTYRTYTEEDIRELQKILILRRMRISLDEIRSLQNGACRLDDLLAECERKLSAEKADAEKTLRLIRMVSVRHETYASLHVEDYWNMPEVESAVRTGSDTWHVRKERKASFDWKLGIAVAGVCAVGLAIVLPFCWMVWWQLRYHDFTIALASDLSAGKKEGTVSVLYGNERIRPSDESLSQLYRMILDGGPGQPGFRVPKKDPVVVSFGNGSILFLYEDGETGGTTVRSLEADGKCMQYMQEDLDWHSVLQTVRRE